MVAGCSASRFSIKRLVKLTSSTASRLSVHTRIHRVLHKHHRFGKGLSGVNDLYHLFLAVGRNAEQLDPPTEHQKKPLRRLALLQQQAAGRRMALLRLAEQAFLSILSK